jgi:hypothetical protein
MGAGVGCWIDGKLAGLRAGDDGEDAGERPGAGVGESNRNRCRGGVDILAGEYDWIGRKGSVGHAANAGDVLLNGYVYADAKRRGMRYVMWTWPAILIPNAIGVILYFVLRDPLLVNCTQWGAQVQPKTREMSIIRSRNIGIWLTPPMKTSGEA